MRERRPIKVLFVLEYYRTAENLGHVLVSSMVENELCVYLPKGYRLAYDEKENHSLSWPSSSTRGWNVGDIKEVWLYFHASQSEGFEEQ